MQIKFKGKSIKTGEWVYGKSIIQHESGIAILERGSMVAISQETPEMLVVGTRIIPKTLSQYTGIILSTLRNIDGKSILAPSEIYDGDKIGIYDQDHVLVNIITVNWQNGVYWAEPQGSFQTIIDVCGPDIEPSWDVELHNFVEEMSNVASEMWYYKMEERE